MSITGLIVAVLFAVIVVLWMLSPYFAAREAVARLDDPVARQRERLEIYYARVLRNLHDLDEDYATGKLNEADYRREREPWVERGMEALRRLDELDATHLVAPGDADAAAIDSAIDDEVEAAIAAQRGDVR